MSFLIDGTKIDVKDYPFLKALSAYEKKKIQTSLFFDFQDATEEVVLEISSFFCHESLKKALKERFGVSSPNVTSFVQEKLFEIEEDKILLNLNYYLAVDVLAHCFLKQEKPNHNAFIKLLENHKVLSILAPLYNYRLQIQSFLNKNFTEDQKVVLLEQSNLYDEPEDTLAMFFNHDDFFVKYLENKSFKDKDSFKKCHDLMSKEMAKLKSKNFVINQEKFFPKIANLKSVNKEYGFVNPSSHHDLVEWGQTLGHCIGSRHYAEAASMGRTLLMGIEKAGEIKYTLEIKNKALVQIQGKSGTRPMNSLLTQIKERLEEQGLLEKSKK